MNKNKSLLRFIGFLVVFTGFFCSTGGMSAPFTPQTPQTVLTTVYPSNDIELSNLRQARRELQKQPGNLNIALSLAQGYLEYGAKNADPRYTGYAQAVLAPWSTPQTTPSARLLVLRATIRQRLHDFTGAMADIKAALAQDPQDPQAWVTSKQCKATQPAPNSRACRCSASAATWRA
jgi:hypothetical protein